MDNLIISAASSFLPRQEILSIDPIGSGNINDTYLVQTQRPISKKTILQKINIQVFNNPEAIVNNITIVSKHLKDKKFTINGYALEVPEIITTIQDTPIHIDPYGHHWRMMSFIDNSTSYQSVESDSFAEEIGKALGWFHKQLIDLDCSALKTTLPDFHNIEKYYSKYQVAKERSIQQNSIPDLVFCHRFIEKRKNLIKIFSKSGSSIVPTRSVIHGDPKINNILFDSETHKAKSLIDLDTVMAGYLLYDIGDCLRSACNIAGEEATDLNLVHFEMGFAQKLLEGYFSESKSILNQTDFDLVFDAVRLIAFELGLRFLTDFLEGDIYFKVENKSQNLGRALVQFRLTEEIEKNEKYIKDATTWR